MASAKRSSVHLDVLDHIEIASPCTMRWEQLTPLQNGRADGNVAGRNGGGGEIGAGGVPSARADTVRHCEHCNLNIYNVTNMTRDEALTLIETWEPGTRLCVGFRRRADGTIITRDCPVGIRAARQRLVRMASRAAAAVTLLLTGSILFARSHGDGQADSQIKQFLNGGETTKARLRDTQPFARVCDLIRPRYSNRGMVIGRVCSPSTNSMASTSGRSTSGN